MKFLQSHQKATIKIVAIVLLLIFVGNFVFRVYQYRNEYLNRFNPAYWQYRYDSSQWVIPLNCPAIAKERPPHSEHYDWCVKNHAMNKKQILLGDDGLYAYEGWQYLQGKDPTALNPEVPPLGKYLIGISIIIFHNQNIFALLSGIFALIALYFISLFLFKKKIVALIPVTVFSLEPLFYTQIRAPFLDLLNLSFFLMTTLFFLKKNYLISGIFLGLMMATKSSAATFIMVSSTQIAYLILLSINKIVGGHSPKKKATTTFQTIWKVIAKEFCWLFVSLLVALVIFTATYIVFFLQGHNVREFLGVQKYIIHFYSIGAKGNITDPWQILIFGKWQTWFAGVRPIPEWHIGWMALTIFSAIYGILCLVQKKIEPLGFLLIWVIVAMAFFGLAPMFPSGGR